MKKIAFVGPVQIHEAFRTMDDSWDMQIPLEKVEDLINELNQPTEVQRISSKTSMIILFSYLYNDNPRQFAEIVSFLAPYSVVCILIPSTDIPTMKPIIERDIKRKQTEDSTNNEGYNVNTPFYFVAYENAQADIYDAISDYVSSPIIDEAVKQDIRGLLPNGGGEVNNITTIEDDFYQPENEEIVIEKHNTNCTTITVTSSKGGSGKSTVSIVLGAYLAQASENAATQGLLPRPLRICLVDLDTRDGQHWLLMGAQRPPTVMEVILGNQDPNGFSQEAVKLGIWHSEKINCDFLFAPKRPRNAKEISANTYAQIISTLQTMYDIVILDTSVNYLDPLGEEVAYPIADRILFVSDMGQSSIVGCSRWIQEEMYAQERGDKNIPPEKVGIVINKAMPNVNMNSAKIEKCVRGLPIISLIPSCPELVTYAANTAELKQILNFKSINEAFKDIAEAVLPDVPLAPVAYKS